VTAAPRGGRRTDAPRRWTRAWLWLLPACVVAIGVADTTLLALGTGYFSGGFNSVYVDGLGQVAAYLVASAILDLGLVLGLWALAVPLLRLARATPLQVFCLAGILAVGVPATLAIARYNLHVTLGHLVSVSLLRVGSGGSSIGMASIALDELPPYGEIAAALLALGVLIVVTVARRLEKRLADAGAQFAPPPPRSLWLGFAGLTVLGSLILTTAPASADRLQYGLVLKPSRTLLAALIQHITDVDRDGYGVLSRPRDSQPFDADIHPFAPEIPANGIDENGLAGDLPAGFELPAPVAAPLPAEGPTPHFLLIYLESFRADLLGQRLGDREITPFLSRLAQQNAHSERAFVHSPWTVPSRSQLFAGSLVPEPGGTTLIDDFKQRGYTVAYFSGQDDSFSNSDEVVGVSRADRFYDARQDLDRRTSRTTAAVSLQVSWKTLLERVQDYLDTVDPDRPLFLYVNLVDTHFPYDHDELDDLLGVERIRRSEIRSDRAERVREAYANTAANVDRAAERLVRSWRERLAGRAKAILVTGDHGQAFYEHGTLGHGQALDDAQSRVPFILSGIGGEWPEPIAPSDVRGLLRRHLFAERQNGTPRAEFVAIDSRRIVQYAGELVRPHLLGLRGVDGALIYDVRNDRLSVVGPDASRVSAPDAAQSEEFRTLIWSWETIQRRVLGLEARGPAARAAPPPSPPRG
jgi:hypothetical protein